MLFPYIIPFLYHFFPFLEWWLPSICTPYMNEWNNQWKNTIHQFEDFPLKFLQLNRLWMINIWLYDVNKFTDSIGWVFLHIIIILLSILLHLQKCIFFPLNFWIIFIAFPINLFVYFSMSSPHKKHNLKQNH